MDSMNKYGNLHDRIELDAGESFRAPATAAKPRADIRRMTSRRVACPAAEGRTGTVSSRFPACHCVTSRLAALVRPVQQRLSAGFTNAIPECRGR